MVLNEKVLLKIKNLNLALLFFILLSNNIQSQEYVFISDTQDYISVEYLYNVRNNNTVMRDSLLADISRSNVNAVFHLGDLVSKGYNNSDWKTIDNFVENLKLKNIPFYPILGNHELIFFPERGEANFQKRYPHHSHGGYLIRDGSLAVLLLNSNFGHISEDEIANQEAWLKETLEYLDDDESVKLVIIGTHHSPFTNSTSVSPNEKVQKDFVEKFMNSEKTKLFVSGHTHAFEHFKFDEKDFLVIGGGGGPQQKLLTGSDARWKDLFNTEDKIRRFHYIKVIKEINDYKIIVIMADSTYSYLEQAYEFVISH